MPMFILLNMSLTGGVIKICDGKKEYVLMNVLTIEIIIVTV